MYFAAKLADFLFLFLILQLQSVGTHIGLNPQT